MATIFDKKNSHQLSVLNTGLLGCMSSPRPRLLLVPALPLTSPFAISLGLVFAKDRGLDSIELSREELYVFACINLHNVMTWTFAQ